MHNTSFPSALRPFPAAIKQSVTIEKPLWSFEDFYAPVIAINENLKHDAFRLRHDVYCREKKFEPEQENQLEFDQYDTYACHGLLRDNTTGNYAGTVRIITPTTSDETLPIEDACSDAMSSATLKPSNFMREEICEISRLAVPVQYRQGSTKGDRQPDVESEARKMVPTGLYLMGASLAMAVGRQHAFVMMEPRLARAMGIIGVKFQQIGDVIDYHGMRAPFYINSEMLISRIRPAFQSMFARINQSVMNAVNESYGVHS